MIYNDLDTCCELFDWSVWIWSTMHSHPSVVLPVCRISRYG